jgi:hypothetical protein
MRQAAREQLAQEKAERKALREAKQAQKAVKVAERKRIAAETKVQRKQVQKRLLRPPDLRKGPLMPRSRRDRRKGLVRTSLRAAMPRFLVTQELRQILEIHSFQMTQLRLSYQPRRLYASETRRRGRFRFRYVQCAVQIYLSGLGLRYLY